MQNRAARVITGKSYARIKLATIDGKMGNNKAIFMHKVANGEYLEKISNFFVVKNNDNCNLRNNGIGYAPRKAKNKLSKKSISYCGAKMWKRVTIGTESQ